jgi:hypothetical protein
MLYGLRHVGSGLAAVISSALTPISLLGFSVALGQEQFNRRQVAAIALGVIGIFVLFGPAAFRGELDTMELLGATGVIVGCLCYTAGSVLARPLMRTLAPAQVAATTNLLGGLMLLVLSLLFEPGGAGGGRRPLGLGGMARLVVPAGPRLARRHHDLFPAGARLGGQPHRDLRVRLAGGCRAARRGDFRRAAESRQRGRHGADADRRRGGVAAVGWALWRCFRMR